MNLSTKEAQEIKNTLDLARNGKATLVQLASAHDLAEKGTLNGCLGEIRVHMAARVNPPRFHVGAKEILLGVISGMLTAHILKEI
jgi:hypothetical protein